MSEHRTKDLRCSICGGILNPESVGSYHRCPPPTLTSNPLASKLRMDAEVLELAGMHITASAFINAADEIERSGTALRELGLRNLALETHNEHLRDENERLRAANNLLSE